MGFLLRRLVFYFAAFLVAATINFFLPRLMPGDPIEIMFSSAGSTLTLDNLNALRLTFGFIDAPLWQQYLTYLKSVFTGDLGLSIRYFPLPVTDLLGRALIWTLTLVGIATVFSFIFGTLLGVVAAWRRGSKFDSFVSLLSIFATSIPAVVVALLVLFLFGYTLRWFPNGYAADPMIDPAFSWVYIKSVLYHGTLPMLTLVFVLTGGFVVTMRNNMINLLGEDYIVMGRAKGLAERDVMLWYAARNALLPTVSNLAIALGTVLSGSLVVEVVFNYPGLGNTLYQAILARDYPVIQGQLLIMTGAMLVANFLVDLSYVLLDPRLKKG
ncbi:ABC transporter permease [Ketogulonicigenium vulgare]|uniref:ABC transporter permease n=1 Tax=Ketogulonicigenium vulgare TaxID=92945 RepID=UPI0001E677B2|nr:ABC transporter permease [Ketogulonicigenium vulgare]ADO41454.1 binding-protein-dependent transport systems inner membrane component [Ketogulonicigenium vulgare Y25]ALJ79934.1 peptide ABC transporter permease [Ketogulonicigenium vulgare]ANW32828.1 peptide ABC transporter permease [Ketogulonicigenium vulgare]AOZ53389.1 binding-protein-dependent transporters inner membrane component [Ketogulonicigenium vulgare]